MSPIRPLATRLAGDPRHYQIAVLASLLAYGIFGLDLEVEPVTALAVLATALAAQAAWTRIRRLPRFEPRSALISGLSLCLLLRTGSPAVAAAAAVLAISSKFVLRAGGKHVWNPANFGLVAILLAGGRAWVSPGQWGSPALFAFAVAGFGLLVVRRAERSDVTWAFLASYGALLALRTLWLGDPWAIPLHQVSSGAFLIFAFFMISDPKTTPDSRLGRLLFAALVALGALYVQFHLYHPNGPIWALAAAAPLVPLLDRLLPGSRFAWAGRRSRPAERRPRAAAGVGLIPRRQP